MQYRTFQVQEHSADQRTIISDKTLDVRSIERLKDGGWVFELADGSTLTYPVTNTIVEESIDGVWNRLV